LGRSEKNINLKFIKGSSVCAKIDVPINKLIKTMKFIYTLSFLIIIAFVSSCAKLEQTKPYTGAIPSGTFTGKYLYIHNQNLTGIKDTISTNLILTMQSSTGYTVTGDTSTVHAGSHGSFIISSDYTSVDFFDSTYPTSGKPAKHHLNGVYEYIYDGVSLQIAVAEPGDSTVSLYNLIKTGN
jgi:hypothetical protein